MAVKTWSAGEVLAAADLNDTIADAKNAPAPSNLLYNGAMQVAQRGTSTASITSSGYYSADRWRLGIGGGMGTWTDSVETDAPSGSGLAKSVKILCTTADASPAADGQVNWSQRIEGQNVQRVKKGNADAEQLTLSFWVKSNVTGTYVVELFDQDNTRQVSASYSISVSATWERKTITFPADTTGALDNDNQNSLFLNYWLGAGTDRTSGTLNTTWASSTNANRAVGQTNLAAATNNYWQVTGVQLEVGPTATPFEFKSYGQELAECQRYYCKGYPYATAPGSVIGTAGGLKFYQPATAGFQATVNIQFPVTMRSSPTFTFYNPNTGTTGQALTDASTTVTPATTYLNDNFAAAYVVGATTWANAYSQYTASAEL
jgi:hypothetical protein